MSATTPGSVDPPGPRDGPATELAERLAGEMAEAWGRGEASPAESYLARHPELIDRSRAVVRLVYEEVCLRQERGQEVRGAELAARFPRWGEQLDALVKCHELFSPALGPPRFPEAGESLGEFELLAILGQGAEGRVFLAAQPALADRPVVLKVMSARSREDVLLARLQHTHIVPLHSAHDFPARGLRALCMPHLGGASLHAILAALRGRPPRLRSGSDLIQALDRGAACAPESPRRVGRRIVTRLPYVQAICWIVGRVAEALAHAHDRGLLHLDVKPSNLLISGDGEPMLLDFHLAHGPLAAGDPPPRWLGGTPTYSPPEQRAAIEAARLGRPVPAAIDGRADIFALGLVLHEALAGSLPAGPGAARLRRRLRRENPRVTPALAALTARCLAPDPRDRYPGAAELAADLDRFLADRPLAGVPDRDPRECWRRWRRRHPQALGRGIAALALLGAPAAAVGPVLIRRTEADVALRRSSAELRDRDYAAAVLTLRHGLELLERTPAAGTLRADLRRQLRRAERGRAATRLHELVDQLRFLHGAAALDPGAAAPLREALRSTWAARDAIADTRGADLDLPVEEQVRADLVDLAVLWADLLVRTADPHAAGPGAGAGPGGARRSRTNPWPEPHPHVPPQGPRPGPGCGPAAEDRRGAFRPGAHPAPRRRPAGGGSGVRGGHRPRSPGALAPLLPRGLRLPRRSSSSGGGRVRRLHRPRPRLRRVRLQPRPRPGSPGATRPRAPRFRPGSSPGFAPGFAREAPRGRRSQGSPRSVDSGRRPAIDRP